MGSGNGGMTWQEYMMRRMGVDPSTQYSTQPVGPSAAPAAPMSRLGPDGLPVPDVQLGRDWQPVDQQGLPWLIGMNEQAQAAAGGNQYLPIAFRGGQPTSIDQARAQAWNQAGAMGWRNPQAQQPGRNGPALPWAGQQSQPSQQWLMTNRQRLNAMPISPPAAPRPWYEQPMWQYTPGGQSPLAGVPEDQWANREAQLAMTLPWAQLAQYDQRNQFDQGMANRQFSSAEEQRAFDNWMAQQQLAMQQGQQGQDNAWRNRQMDLQQQQQEFERRMQEQGFTAQQAQQAWQNQFQQNDWNRQGQQFDRTFDAQRQDAAWSQQFQQQDWTRAGQQWQAQFDANRADTSWNQGFQTTQADRAQNNWQSEFNANRADTSWNQGFSERQFGEDTRRFDVGQAFNQAQFDWSKQEAERNRALQEQGQYLGAFGRRFGPAIGSM